MNTRPEPMDDFDVRLRAALGELPHGTPPVDFARAVAAEAGVNGCTAEAEPLLGRAAA
jgi:hypothetical protein